MNKIRVMGMLYAVFLVWAVLWKCGVPFIGDGTGRVINLLPLAGNTTWELQFNIAIFVPFGFYAAAITRKPVLLVLLTSLVLEALQFVLAIGRSDVTDLLTNTLGGIIGIAAFCILSKLFGGNRHRAVLVCCVLITLFLVYITVSFIIFGWLNIGFMMIKLT